MSKRVLPDGSIDGAVAAVGLGTVSGALTVEIMLFHRALEAFSLGDADDIDVPGVDWKSDPALIAAPVRALQL